MKKKFVFIILCSFAIYNLSAPSALYAQSHANRDTIVVAAKEIIMETTYCALVTIDSTGQLHVRTMNPFPVNDEFITWFATSRTSRKVKEIKNNPNVSVYYANHLEAKGYVSIRGTATVIDDKELLVKMKRDYWEGIQGWRENFVLIKIIPNSLEVINYKHGLYNDPTTLRAPSISF